MIALNRCKWIVEEWRINRLNLKDYNWEDEGFNLISRFYDDIAQLLDDKFKVKLDKVISRRNYNHILLWIRSKDKLMSLRQA